MKLYTILITDKVFYVIERDKVIVTRVLYSASDINRRLEEK